MLADSNFLTTPTTRMPHLTLEYTSNLSSFDATVAITHIQLCVEVLEIERASCAKAVA